MQNILWGMNMNIAILGWGSLIYDPGILKFDGEWRLGGPELPIEFSRISGPGIREKFLTLVIDPKIGKWLTTFFTISTARNLLEAKENLRDRENTGISKIGYINLNEADHHCNHGEAIVEVIKDWAHAREFDCVIWTDLETNFKEKSGKAFIIKKAIDYLNSLDYDTREKALCYICRAPIKDTPLRQELRRINWYLERYL
jgi:hypothetical protein